MTRRLDDDLSLYFAEPETSVLIPLGLLLPTKPPHSQPDSVAEAGRRMAMAARGELPKRGPITVETGDGRTFHITDGNATYGVALGNGWSHLPATVRVVGR